MPRTAVVDDTPLGSLTQPAARSARRCAECGSNRLTELSMTLTDGTPVAFVSCRACEHRTWATALHGTPDEQGVGHLLAFDQVIERTRKVK